MHKMNKDRRENNFSNFFQGEYEAEKNSVLLPFGGADESESLIRARELLRKENYTCVLIKEDEIYVSRQRGITPLLTCYKEQRMKKGCFAADKVVGKAAAYFYVLLGIKELYAEIISIPAYNVLTKNGISVYYREKVPAIINRTGDGYCPMETAVWEIENPEEALQAVEKTLLALQKNM